MFVDVFGDLFFYSLLSSLLFCSILLVYSLFFPSLSSSLLSKIEGTYHQHFEEVAKSSLLPKVIRTSFIPIQFGLTGGRRLEPGVRAVIDGLMFVDVFGDLLFYFILFFHLFSSALFFSSTLFSFSSLPFSLSSL
jgi:hypothetical protein